MENNNEQSQTRLSVLDEAIIFAVNAHSGYMRKGSNIPYILHPLEAAAIVATMTEDEEVIAAAVLHDVVEDTYATIDDIKDKFGDAISRLVAAETENKREGQSKEETWRIRKQETIEHLMYSPSRDVKLLTLGDKLSNIRAIYKDYKAVGNDVWLRFNQKDSNEHAWYYKAVMEVTSDLYMYPAWQEFKSLVTIMFGE
ncbi:MAG: guanosine polyphosphate synthetase/pyrophosphohydrolase [Firmicutes bacterium]|nr:guanosine polyphosphate synthetase/pyrophosphohydrolase [Bacillota bacterium]